MNQVIKTLATCYGYVFLMVATILLTILFSIAFLSPDKAVTIVINRYGEATIEMVLVLAGFACSTPLWSKHLVQFCETVVDRFSSGSKP